MFIITVFTHSFLTQHINIYIYIHTLVVVAALWCKISFFERVSIYNHCKKQKNLTEFSFWLLCQNTTLTIKLGGCNMKMKNVTIYVCGVCGWVFMISFLLWWLWNNLFLIHYFMIWLWFWLFGFYGISTFVGYLMPNPFLYK